MRRMPNNKTHGMTKTRVYRCWHKMKLRCLDSRQAGYKRYGGRGITVCERWLSFENFYADMGEPPSNDHSLDRKNNDGNYEPENCRWATRIEQANNTRTNRRITANGEMRTIAEWASLLGVDMRMIHCRLRRGWTEQEAIDGSGDKLARKLTDSDVNAIRASSKSQKDLAADFGVSRAHIWNILHGRKRTGIPLKEPAK